MIITRCYIDTENEVIKTGEIKYITQLLAYLNKFELVEEKSFVASKGDSNADRDILYEHFDEWMELSNAILYKEDVLYHIILTNTVTFERLKIAIKDSNKLIVDTTLRFEKDDKANNIQCDTFESTVYQCRLKENNIDIKYLDDLFW